MTIGRIGTSSEDPRDLIISAEAIFGGSETEPGEALRWLLLKTSKRTLY